MKNKQYYKDTNLSSINLDVLLKGSFVMAILSGCFYSMIQYSFGNSMISFVSAMFMFGLMMLNRGKKYVTIVRITFILYINFILLPVAWVLTYGSKGPMPFYSIIFIVISSLLISSIYEFIIPILMVVEVLLLWAYEDQMSSLITSLSNDYNASMNDVIHYAPAGLVLCVIMYFNKKHTDNINSKLTRLSMMDELTKLYNRRTFFDLLNSLHEESKRMSKKYFVLMMDIDNLKTVNDTYGHQVGDEVIRKTGEIIKGCIRVYDIGGRYGGDEFLVAIANADNKMKDTIINRILDEFNEYAKKFNKEQVGLSIGCSESNGKTVNEVIKQADLSLYENKQKKHNNRCYNLR